ncbi:TetR/AcrR family transcriptional regulator [Rhodococcus rhodnii]|uniref:HTH tetR-type domain-containing protein n=2 Tax=Rhodococcus rhodnii TaxID=38312 RepID=R7WNF5_9NOCA|nr:helix-turn-helix domain-containing protein [Rhodococcus rhodnii]EOM76828.1 hypothetical protein Rrhod_1741 [Rhodococcus rhodnii LMG 5362]TXG89795.1 TetR/AcrR family transcriptional regulator [Rhodococcus rhodnii]
MAKHGERARTALLDSAEELFALNGIGSVSNRRIAEHAGNSNHSAVSYHFGGRDELLDALVARHTSETRRLRADRVAAMPAEPELVDVLRALVLPTTDTFGGLPVPSWRAGLLQQLRNTPSTAAIVAAASSADPRIAALADRMRVFTAHVPEGILSGRGRILGTMISDVCAEYEAGIREGSYEPNWIGVGHFLTDSAAGLLAAPVTHPADFHTGTAAYAAIL